jgi:hypothetical protein
MNRETIFGNSLPKGSLNSALRTFNRYAKKFSWDPAWQPVLKAQPMPLGHELFGIQNLMENQDVPAGPLVVDNEKGIVIGTIRMGFGHYRISLAMASAARSMGLTPYWLDYMAFPGSTPSQAIKSLEGMYNWASRLSQQFKLFNKLVWERITSDMAQKLSYTPRDRELSRLFAPLCGTIPKDMPYISTHPWAGLAAVHSGLENIVTVVPDNYPLAFHLVEGSIHAVQTPSAYLGYRSLRNMGDDGQHLLNPIPESQIRYTGHFVDHELVDNIEIDCDRRFRRIHNHLAKRILLTIGGAGAQVQRFLDIIDYCNDGVTQRKLALMVNMGDHEGRWLELKAGLELRGIPYVLHSGWEDSRDFAVHAMEADIQGIHVFLHKEIFAAVYLTNLLMRACDLMVTKPSELSFYPVPKLFIQRVGRHEAWGAIRGAEIGDGTLETSSIGGVYQTIRLIMQSDDLLHLYCTNIIKNKKIGIYDGAYNVMRIAQEEAARLKHQRR